MKLIINRRRNKLKTILFTTFFLFASSVIANAIQLPDGTDAVVKNVEIFDSGKMKSVFLVEPTSIKTPIGKFLFFEEKHSIEFGEIDIDKTDQVENNSKVEFFENGNFKSGYLKEKTVISTPVGKYAVLFISFYEDGKLEKFSCPAEYNVKVKGSNFTRIAKNPPKIKTNIGLLPIGGIVELYPSSNIKRVTINNEFFYTITAGNFKSIEITKSVEFFENGNISSMILNKPQIIKSNSGNVRASGKISLWENGNIKNVEFPEAITINTPSGYLNLNKLFYYETGELMGGLSMQTRKVGGEYIMFSKEGKNLGIAEYDEKSMILKISE